MTQFLDSTGAQRLTMKLRELINGKAASGHKHNVKINGATKTITGETTVDLGTYLTAHQDISQYVNNVETIGSGNIITSVTKNGKKLTFNKGLTLAAELFIIPQDNKLPTDPSTIKNNRIYLIKAGITGTNDSYIEYVYLGSPAGTYDANKWEKLGEVKVNMANYYNKTDSDGRFAAKSHSHNYAGSASAGGAATSALKLVTSANAAVTAGSEIQPAFFSNGVPSACKYKLEKSVPSNAVFTDTNTWRPIQNNLTSDATDQSLSAAQGKELKRLVDGKAASNHTHSYLPLSGGTMTGKIISSTTAGMYIEDRDKVALFKATTQKQGYSPVVGVKTALGAWTIGNTNPDESLIFNYTSDANYKAGNNNSTQVLLPTKSGTIITTANIANQSVKYATSAGTANSVAWGNVSGKPSSFTPASHTHSYAGSSTAGGSANSAVKLDTSAAGSGTQPVYFKDGKPVACGFTVATNVPSGAKFTDTTYGVATTSANGLMSASDKSVLNKLNQISGEINITDINLTNTVTKYLVKGTATRLNVIATVNSVTSVVGVLEIISDAQKHQVTEVFTTNLIPVTATGSLREFDTIDASSHTDTEVYTYYRVYNNAIPTDTTTRGKWSKWKEIGGSRVRDYVNALVSNAVSTGHTASADELSLLKDSLGRGYVKVSSLAIPTSTIDGWF